ncbi:MAG: hypothetical protein BWY91_00908 [bacterium ADurb.BinA028]|nr:MAG: hypothetical protein BWY91_00908 [bacterium ADurb.BinA028]
MLSVVAQTAGTVPTVLVRVIAGPRVDSTSIATGTITSSVPLPGPASGSSLAMQRFAS